MSLSSDLSALNPDAERNPELEVRCPADGRLVGKVPDMTRQEVSVAAEHLRAVQPEWESLGADGRARFIYRFLDWVLDNERELVELIQAEGGKSWGDAKLEIAIAVDLVNYYGKHATRFLADRTVRSANLANSSKKLRVAFKPYQLVGIITPWNGPFAGPMLDGVPALMAGASVIFKPSELAPLAWERACRGWIDEVGAPPVLANVTGGPATGEAVVDIVDMIMFTGATSTGRKIAAHAGQRLIPASLELGGNDAMIVLSDANLERAVNAAVWGSLWNAGQGCVCVERVYVEAPLYGEFVARVVTRVRDIRVGMDAPESYESDIGALAAARQVDTVERHVRDALEKGATALVGGRRRDGGHFFEPTVLTDVDHSMLCMQEETFGPILPIMKVSDEAEAIRLANDSRYGLSCSVWSFDKGRAERVARQIEAGAANINNVIVSTLQLPVPMSGWKESGLGSRSGGASGLLKYCRSQSIVTERLNLKAEPYWYPHRASKAALQGRMMRLLGAHDWKRRLKG